MATPPISKRWVLGCALWQKYGKIGFVDVVAERGRAVRQGGGGDVRRNFVSFCFDGWERVVIDAFI